MIFLDENRIMSSSDQFTTSQIFFNKFVIIILISITFTSNLKNVYDSYFLTNHNWHNSAQNNSTNSLTKFITHNWWDLGRWYQQHLIARIPWQEANKSSRMQLQLHDENKMTYIHLTNNYFWIEFHEQIFLKLFDHASENILAPKKIRWQKIFF